MERDFYIAHGEVLSYSDLIRSLNETSVVKTHYKANSFVDFVTNLLAGIIHDLDLIMYDFYSQAEAGSDEEIKVELSSISDKDDLIQKILESKSQIGIFSSGSEGPPKLIYQSMAKLLKAVRIEDRYKGRSWGFTYNPAHSAGIQVLLQVLANGGTLVGLHAGNRQEKLALMEETNMDYLSGTPTFYRMLAPFDFEVASVKSVTLNGEKSTMELIKQVMSAFPNARIRNIYGSTEAGSLMSSETDVFLVPERLQEKLRVSEGELFFHSSIVSHSVGASEWYASGDLVEVIADTPLQIRFISRKSRILNVGGHNVNPQHVEEAILQLAGVKDARVFGKENRLIGNLLIAEVVLIDGFEYSEQEVMDKLAGQLASYKIPRIIRFTSEMATGRTGKKLI